MAYAEIKAIIIDDDEFIHQHLRDKLARLAPDVRIVGCAENAAHGRQLIQSARPELVFLDIQMPEASGFDLLNSFDNLNFSVVFITSYNQYAIQAIRYSALDYLLKPINDQELFTALQRLRERRNPGYLRLQIENLIHNLSRNDGELRLVIATRQGDVSLPVTRIMWCEGDSNYTHLHLSDKSKITASKTLKDFEDMLPEKAFLRVHKSHLVNIDYVHSLTGDGHVVLHDNVRLEVARRRLKDVKAIIETRRVG
jgi:two-component system LytT family response regulator